MSPDNEKETSAGDRPRKYVVGRADDVPDGSRLIVDVNGRSVGIFNVAGTYYALLNRCPHRGAQLCRGQLVGSIESDAPGEIRYVEDSVFLVCPWHGWEYDLKTGQSWFDPQRCRVRPYPVDVESGETLTKDLSHGVADIPMSTGGEIIDSTTHRVKGPYTAGVFPITVENDYLVVSLRALEVG